MKIVLGPTALETRFYDDEGQPLNLAVRSLNIEVADATSHTIAHLEVYVDEVVAEVDDDNVIKEP